MTRKSKIIWTIFIVFAFFVSTGLSYAYFSLSVEGNNSAQDVNVGTSKLSLQYNDTLAISGDLIQPGWSQTKTLSVSNNGSEGVAYAIGWQNLINTITNDELVISGTCTSNLSGYSCDGISSQSIANYSSYEEASSGSVVYAIKDGIYIDVGETHTYTITVSFINTSSNQNYNQGKAFSGTLGIVASGATTTVTLNVLNGTTPVTTGISGTINSNPINGTLTDGKLVFNNVPVGNHTLTLTVGDNTYTKPIAVGLSTTSSSSSVESGVRTKVTATSSGVEVNATISNNTLSVEAVVPKTLYQTVADQTLGTGSTLNSGAGINFTNPSSSTNGRGVYTYTHDSTKGTIDSESGTQTIYYFRGNVTNNNVLFAGYCWLIVRTTDTGGVKLLYNGTPVDNTCPSYRTTESTVPLISTDTVWNNTTYSVLYSASNVKTVVDSWISTNLTSYSSKLETINWCNNADGQQYDDDANNYSIEYSGYARVDGGTPQLECTYNNDKYSLIGALLTVDEAVLAGQSVVPGAFIIDPYINVYNTFWWLLSAASNYEGMGMVFLSLGGVSSVVSDSVDQSYAVRPSISLNSSVMVSAGDGSVSSPYTIQ